KTLTLEEKLKILAQAGIQVPAKQVFAPINADTLYPVKDWRFTNNRGILHVQGVLKPGVSGKFLDASVYVGNGLAILSGPNFSFFITDVNPNLNEIKVNFTIRQ